RPAERELAYWRGELAGLPVLELPCDRPRPAVRSFRAAAEPLALPAERLQELSAQQGTTLYLTLLAAFQLLLARTSGQPQTAVGLPVAGRGRPELEALVGPLTNILVLRGDLRDDDLSFVELLARVREAAHGACAHHQLPFELLVEELEPERNLSQNPVVQVLFVLRSNAFTPPRELSPGLDLEVAGVATGAALYELTLDLEEDRDELRGVLEYHSDLYDATTLRRMAGHFRTLLAGLAADPHRRLRELPWMSAGEAQQVTAEWNDAGTAYPREASVQELFAAQVAATPDAVAVAYGTAALAEEQVSYRELNRRANQLAHTLRELGVGRSAGPPEVLAGIYLERSVSLVVGILAVLKAGGAYLPLDLSYPTQRLALMLEDARAPVLITVEALAAALPATLAERGVKVLCLDRDGATIARSSGRDPEPIGTLGGRALAYAIYTSGSTGRPKGVAVDHRAIVRLVFNTNYIALGPGDRMAQASNTSFDAATFELWGALLHGARLVGIPKEVALSPRAFADALGEHGITALFLTTALFNQIAGEEPAALGAVRHLLFGGEAVDPHWVREVLAAGQPPGRLLHVYGPTESTTFTSWYRVREVPARARTVPIGGPLANTDLYVLDRGFAPVPAGVAGELWIGGDGLARGYLHRPALTAERFVPHPFARGRRGGKRLYRTGDLVRFLPGGEVEFLGRLDDQVKLRGFRVELGEIEAVLDQHPGVRESAVLARDDRAGK
ncbi:MAG: amino acid adenylation domain-containing protein, partial [bacterium]|nr:amino acid adenylation domain-containing protein [bacterium]